MQKIKQQIEKFWLGKTSLKDNRQLLQSMDESSTEWKSFLQAEYEKVLSVKGNEELDEEQKQRVWVRLQKNTLGVVVMKSRTKKPMQVFLWRAAAAACILLMAGWGIYRVMGIQDTHPIVHNVAARKIPSLHMAMDQNLTHEDKKIVLPDSSLVILSPGGTIRYQKQMGMSARNIYLEGKASFDVAKDAARPFTVLAEGFTTTALGTKFIVDAEKKHCVSILLLRGRVVVKATSDVGFSMSDVYLVPGQQFHVNAVTGQFGIKENKKLAGEISKRKQSGTDNPDLKENKGLSFDKTPLCTVFHTIEKRYKTKIAFDSTQVQGRLFTGEFTPSDPLLLTLTSICNMNGLSFEEKENIIFISKQK